LAAFFWLFGFGYFFRFQLWRLFYPKSNFFRWRLFFRLPLSAILTLTLFFVSNILCSCNARHMIWFKELINLQMHSLCCPLLVPQITPGTGGTKFPVLLAEFTAKLSVPQTPSVVGAVKTKLLKSNLQKITF
jgi:hypothetical protein